MRRPPRWHLLLTLLALPFLLGACSAALPACREAGRTARLMPAFFAGLPADPSGWGAPAIVYETVPLRPEPDGATLHIWRPVRGQHPALVVSLGVNPAPPDDPRVVRLFRGLARAGIVAVLVQSTALDEDRLTPAAPDLVVQAFEWVAAAPPVAAGRVGLVGFSVGAGIVTLAAADPRIRDRIALVEAFGGYFSLPDLALQVTSRTLTYGGRTEPWEPDPLSVSVLRKNLIAGVESAHERDALTRALVDATAQPPPVTALSDGGRTVLALLTTTDPAEPATLLARLPSRQLAELRALSPLYVLDNVRAPVFLMHDRGDPLIPYVQSRTARDTLAAAGRPPYYSEFDIFRHVEPGRGGNPTVLARDGVRLFTHIYWLLRRL